MYFGWLRDIANTLGNICASISLLTILNYGFISSVSGNNNRIMSSYFITNTIWWNTNAIHFSITMLSNTSAYRFMEDVSIPVTIFRSRYYPIFVLYKKGEHIKS